MRSRSNVLAIVLSIQADENQKGRVLRSGADDHMAKRFGITELARATGDATSLSQLR
jgi:DNA-binding response OmpR family regulator